MIVCPNCKEEIDDDSWYCDQCGQHLSFCEHCGKVGLGRRCTSCGNVMLPSEEYYGKNNAQPSQQSAQVETTLSPSAAQQLMLINDAVGIHLTGINGAILGRRQGPYAQSFQQYPYVSGVHAQIKYDVGKGWSITDKHSSNGTKVNNQVLVPDVETLLRNDDTIVLANVSLKVSIK